MPNFLAIALENVAITGPDPFVSGIVRNTSAFNTSTLTVQDNTWVDLNLRDRDNFFEDQESRQRLLEPTEFNGETWRVGTVVTNEYSYVVRPVGSVDPEDEIIIYALDFNGDVTGFAASERLQPGLTYEIIPGGSDFPTVPYSDLVVCFAKGTQILTTKGYMPVQKLHQGCMVETLDNGPQPLAWIGKQDTKGILHRAPVRVGRGILGNSRPLLLSQQHRVLLRPGQGIAMSQRDETLVSIKGLINQRGIRLAPRETVTYYHLLFDRHQIVWANGALAESLLPGQMALKSLDALERQRLFDTFPELRGNAEWAPARHILRPAQWRRYNAKQQRLLLQDAA